MQYINNFISVEDSQYIINLINQNHTRSSVVEGVSDRTAISDYRTSSTSNLDMNDPVISKINNKIAALLNLDVNKGEAIQGQMYEVGQYFKPHHDYFTGAGYDMHCKASGNRTHTLMVYLNQEFEGGGTNFPKLNQIVLPETGKALWWENMINGELQESSLHEGMPVTAGKKYIITSWWREKSWDGAGDEKQYSNLKSKIVKVENPFSNTIKEKLKVYTDKSQLPIVTENGFEIRKCPEQTWKIIQDAYGILKNKNIPEEFEGKEDFIKGGGSELLPFDSIPSIRDLIHSQLLDIHKDFSKQNIVPSYVYGIRSYLRGATLTPHYERVETHHISSIIVVDKDLKCGCQNKKYADDWPLDIKGHDGEWYKVYAQPGDMILYESAVCEHGRNEPFGGTFFRNFYTHYKYNH